MKVVEVTTLREGGARLTLESLGAPALVMVSEHAVPESSEPWDPDAMHALGRAVYDAMRGAALDAGLVEEGMPTWQNAPRRRRRHHRPEIVWGSEVAASIERQKAHPPRCTCGGFPIGRVIWTDTTHETFVMVVSDVDQEMARDIYAWGPGARSSLEAVEGAIGQDRFWT